MDIDQSWVVFYYQLIKKRGQEEVNLMLKEGKKFPTNGHSFMYLFISKHLVIIIQTY